MQIEFTRLREFRAALAIRRGLVMLIPVLMIGSFSLVLRSLPIPAYQTFINWWADGALYQIINSVYNATFGMLAIYMATVIGYSYGILKDCLPENAQYGTLLVSFACFGILSGGPAVSAEVFGPKGVFVAIIAACLSSWLFSVIAKRVKPIPLFSDGADIPFSNAINMIFPTALTIIVFALANFLILAIFHTPSVHELIIQSVSSLLLFAGDGIFGGCVFIFVSSILWFFGIHGSDLLDGVVTQIFVPATEMNAALAASGQAPTQILTKPFFDIFVLMGGCGATLGLLVALLLFCERGGTRRMVKLSFVPMLFNINEILVFGLPIVFNPTFLVPFLLTPLISFATSYFAMWSGLVPLVTRTVEWTTPVFFSGYIATGSAAGVILQIVNLLIAILVYRPFVKQYDLKRLNSARQDYAALTECMKKSEISRIPVRLTTLTVDYGWLAKALASDLKNASSKGQLTLYYQPQYQLDGQCIGAEALLRWNHPLLGQIYPPLVIQLAEEAGILPELEEWVFQQATAAAVVMHTKAGWDYQKISVNVTGITILTQRFEHFLEKFAQENPSCVKQICLELTEQAVLQFNSASSEQFMHIRKMGYHLAVDDFSMGNTSIQYLLGGHFDLIKLDGNLVRQIKQNPRCRDVVSSIVQLSNTLGFNVLAEYVESLELRDELASVGCEWYQGWYYGKAMPLEELINLHCESQHP